MATSRLFWPPDFCFAPPHFSQPHTATAGGHILQRAITNAQLHQIPGSSAQLPQLCEAAAGAGGESFSVAPRASVVDALPRGYTGRQRRRGGGKFISPDDKRHDIHADGDRRLSKCPVAMDRFWGCRLGLHLIIVM